MKDKKTLQNVNSGWVSMEVLGALLVIMLAVIYGAERLSEYLDDQEYAVMATHANSFNEAAKNYIADHTDTIATSATATSPVLITPDLLKSNGYLQSGFFNNNSYGQTYVTAVVKNAKMNNTLQALTCTTGGSQIPYKGMRSISTHISGMGGYVNQDNVATGAYGGWQSNTTDFGVNCTTGHIAIALSSEVLGTVIQESDRLYRYQVNGRPDLNKMHTSIDLGSNNLNSVATLNGQTGSFSGNVNAANVNTSSNVTASGSVAANGNVSANSNVTAGNGITANSDIRSNNGWLIAKNSKGWINEDHGGGMYMDDNDWIKSVNGKGIYTSGQLRGGTVRADGRMSVGEYLQLEGQAVEGTSCPSNGLLGRTNEGVTLYCKNGIWTNGNSGNLYISGLGSQSLGTHSFCALMKVNLQARSGDTSDVGTCQVTRDASGVWALVDQSNKNNKGCQAVCF